MKLWWQNRVFIDRDEKAAKPEQEYTSQYSGQTFYFCSDDCKAIFDAAPQQFARRSAGDVASGRNQALHAARF
jgi:YHS domain-containing protein